MRDPRQSYIVNKVNDEDDFDWIKIIWIIFGLTNQRKPSVMVPGLLGPKPFRPGTPRSIRRNIKSKSKGVRESAYNTIVRPQLEYASAVWDPHTKEHISKIEMVQRRVARWTFGYFDNRASVTEINLAFAARHTKEVAYKTLVRPELEYTAPIWHPYHESQIGQVEKVQRTAARWTFRRWRNTSSVGDMLDDLEWPSLETRREQSSLTFFYKIHSGTVSLDKDKYLTPALHLRRTRASHESQYSRYFAYSDALKNSCFPGLSLCGIVLPLQWSHLRPLRSLRLRIRLLVQRYVF